MVFSTCRRRGLKRGSFLSSATKSNSCSTGCSIAISPFTRANFHPPSVRLRGRTVEAGNRRPARAPRPAGRAHDDAVGGRTSGSRTMSPVAFGGRVETVTSIRLAFASASICRVIFATCAAQLGSRQAGVRARSAIRRLSSPPSSASVLSESAVRRAEEVPDPRPERRPEAFCVAPWMARDEARLTAWHDTEISAPPPRALQGSAGPRKMTPGLRIPHARGLALHAGGGSRTHTSLRTRDFESRASASSATPAAQCRS